MFHKQEHQEKEKLLKKTASTDIIGHREYHSKENAFLFSSFFPLV